MKKAALIGLFALSVSLLFAAGFASEQDRARELTGDGTILPLENILTYARGHYPTARILKVKLKSKHGTYYYKIELLDAAGVVHKLKYDAATGKLLDTDVDDDRDDDADD